MNTHIIKILWLFLLLAALVAPAHAFQDPSLSRWLNRDPLGDDGSLVYLRAQHAPNPMEAWNSANLHAYVENNPVNLIDPLGLSSIHAQIASAIARGDVAALEALHGTGVLTAAQSAQVQAAISRLNSTALQWIARNCKGSINREFPSQLYNKTLEQIKLLKDAGDEAAKKAWKLLHDGRFRK